MTEEEMLEREKVEKAIGEKLHADLEAMFGESCSFLLIATPRSDGVGFSYGKGTRRELYSMLSQALADMQKQIIHGLLEKAEQAVNN